MRNLNPTAVVLWAFFGLLGYLIGDQQGALIGVTAALGLTLVVSIF